MTCEDRAVDTKYSCDRSCSVDFNQLAQKMKRALGVLAKSKTNETQSSGNTEKEVANGEQAVRRGPFVIHDNGNGPLIIAKHGSFVIQQFESEDDYFRECSYCCIQTL